MGRIGRLYAIWKTNWEENPAARGAAKMAAGVALMLEGLMGMRARLRGSSGGILLVVFLIPFGLVFFTIGHFIKPEPFDDEVVVQGAIVDTQSHMNRDDQGNQQRMYKAVYGYRVDGKEYRFPSSISTGPKPRVGKKVRLGYSASNPGEARRIDGVDGNFHRVFQGLGLFVILLGFYQLMMCALLIGGGIALFMSGRKDRAIAGATDGFFKDLFSLAHVERTNREALLSGAGGGGFGESSSTSMPPAGWMVDPENSRQMRWWDGTAWTDMCKPAEPERPETSNW